MKTLLITTLSFLLFMFGLIINDQETNKNAVLKYRSLKEVDGSIIKKSTGKLLLNDGYHTALAINSIYYKSSADLTSYFFRLDNLINIEFNTESNKIYSTQIINCNYADTINRNLYFNWPFFQVIENDTKKKVGGIINTIKIKSNSSSSDTIHLYYGNKESSEKLSTFIVNFYFNSLTHLTGRTIDGYNVNYSYEYKSTSSNKKKAYILLKPGYYRFTQFFKVEQELYEYFKTTGYAMNFIAEPKQVIYNVQKLDSYDAIFLHCNQPSFITLLTSNLNDIYFLPDGIHGWIAGDNGILLRTEDGGNNLTFQKKEWEIYHSKNMIVSGYRLKPTYSDINNVYFSDFLNGWVTEEGGGILKTIDGGINWSSEDCKYCKGELFFEDEREGYAIGIDQIYGNMILSTHDGGISWSTIHNTLIGSNYFFINPNDWIWLKGGITGGLFNSVDKGANWIERNSDMHKLIREYGRRDIFFIDKNIGWILLQGYVIGDIYAKEILYTEDGGLTWTSYEVPLIDVINSIYFIDKNTGYMVGNNGIVLKTKDGGKTWEKLRSGTLVDLNDVQFIQNKGWIVGNKGVILITNDGGINWKYINILDFVYN